MTLAFFALLKPDGARGGGLLLPGVLEEMKSLPPEACCDSEDHGRLSTYT